MKASLSKALILDPNPYISDILRGLLFHCGVASVLTAANEAEALDFLGGAGIDVLFCDIHSKPSGGISVLRNIRKAIWTTNADLPVIIMAERANAQMVFDARDAGANEFLAKPLALKGVERVLTAVRENPRAFVKTPVYVGPDRRRRQQRVNADRRRRSE